MYRTSERLGNNLGWVVLVLLFIGVVWLFGSITTDSDGWLAWRRSGLWWCWERFTGLFLWAWRGLVAWFRAEVVPFFHDEVWPFFRRLFEETREGWKEGGEP